MSVLLAAAIIFLVLAFLGHRLVEGRGSRARLLKSWRAFADARGLRCSDEPGRGPTIRVRTAHREGDVDVAIHRAKLGLGEWYFCATARAHASVTTQGPLVAYHRAFPHPSLVASSLPRRDTGDEAFDQRIELRVAGHAREPLPPEVRTALGVLPCAELTVLDDRVTVLWSIEESVPTERDVEAARTIVETLAAPLRSATYR